MDSSEDCASSDSVVSEDDFSEVASLSEGSAFGSSGFSDADSAGGAGSASVGTAACSAITLEAGAY